MHALQTASSQHAEQPVGQLRQRDRLVLKYCEEAQVVLVVATATSKPKNRQIMFIIISLDLN